MQDKPLTQADLNWFRSMREWLRLVDNRIVYSCLTGKPIGTINLNVSYEAKVEPV